VLPGLHVHQDLRMVQLIIKRLFFRGKWNEKNYIYKI
jgi:hypothetical protein